MLGIVLASLLICFNALAAPLGPIVWGNDNNALYLPTNVPSSGTACLTVDPMGVILPQSCGGGGGSGTVTSVGWGTLPPWLVGTGAPITTSGNLGLALPNQTPAKFLASPPTIVGTPSFRSVVATDIPTLNQNTTGSAGSLNTTFASGLPLVGNGTGIPAAGSKSGSTTTFATTFGTLVSGHGVKIDASGNFVDTGVVPGEAAGIDQSVQYKGADGLFKGDSFFRYDYNLHALHVPDIILAQGSDKPAGFTHDNKIEPWDRTGTTKVLVNTDGNPTTPGHCYIFDNDGNFVDSGIACTPAGTEPPLLITGDYTVTLGSLFLLADCMVDCTVSLPDISALDGFKVAMKNIGSTDAVFHNVTGQLIDGHTDFGLHPDKSQINLISSGGFWYVY